MRSTGVSVYTKYKSLAFAAILGLALGSAGGALAHPGGGSGASPGHQHGSPSGHLLGTGAWGNLEFIGKLTHSNLTPNPLADMVADVAVSPDGKWAFLANWGRPTCAANSEAGGTKDPDAGAWVIDISDPANPKQAGFIAHSQDSRPGEGMQVVALETKSFKGWMLVMNNEQCGKNGKGGVSLWDVTNPAKPFKLSEHFGDRGQADTNDIHSSWAWQGNDGKAYVVMTDNFEATDVDILDITNPKRPRLIADYNLNTHFGRRIDQPDIGVTESSLHDMVVKKIDDRFVMLLSYWDGGYVLLDVTDPINVTLIGETDFTNPDPELLESAGLVQPPEGNGHQAEFTADNKYFIATDEDFSPYRSIFTIDTGPNAGEYPAGEFGWTVPVVTLADKKLNGPVVYGGYGCPQSGDTPNRAAFNAVLNLQPGEEAILVLQRGPVGDPNVNYEACFFSEKVEAAQNAGWDAVIVPNHHTGAQGGAAPDAAFCGGQGHQFEIKIPGVCIGHRASHLLFNDEPAYDAAHASEPVIGTLGERASFTPQFDGWGYVHLYDRSTLQELDTYAIDEAHNEAFASGFGDLTVHEVATHPTNSLRAYLSYYSGGMRALEIQCGGGGCELVEVGGYLDPNGNDFWGVETFVRNGETYVLGSDRDSGLWIFRDKTRP